MAEKSEVIRPSAVLADQLAKEVVRQLESRDVSQGGVWSVSPGLWQRYDKAWDGPGGTHGSAQLIGSIAVIYGSPSKYDITIYRVTVTDHGQHTGWSVQSVCDDALRYVDLTLASCPRTVLAAAAPDPFKRRT